MRLDAIVLDLDDTLFDTTGRLLAWADRRAVAAMRAAGLPATEESALARLAALRAEGVVRTFAALAHEHGAGERCVAAGEEAWFVYDPPPMELDPAVADALGALSRLAPLALLTSGHPRTQQGKIDRLGFAPRFAEIRIVDHRDTGGKTAALAALIAGRRWDASRVVVCGDRPDGDVRAGSRNGCLTVLVRRRGAEFSNVAPVSPDDVPWRIVGSVTELPRLLTPSS